MSLHGLHTSSSTPPDVVSSEQIFRATQVSLASTPSELSDIASCSAFSAAFEAEERASPSVLTVATPSSCKPTWSAPRMDAMAP